MPFFFFGDNTHFRAQVFQNPLSLITILYFIGSELNLLSYLKEEGISELCYNKGRYHVYLGQFITIVIPNISWPKLYIVEFHSLV